MNPADLLTRGLDTKIFNDRKPLWFQGPPWLREPEDKWPPQPGTSIHAEYESPQLAGTVMPDNEESPNILNIIDLTKYSTLIRVVRVTALLVLFARKWKTPEVYNDNILTTKEILEARNLLLKATQQITYKHEISYLKKSDKLKKNLPSYGNSIFILTMKTYFAVVEGYSTQIYPTMQSFPSLCQKIIT